MFMSKSQVQEGTEIILAFCIMEISQIQNVTDEYKMYIYINEKGWTSKHLDQISCSRSFQLWNTN